MLSSGFRQCHLVVLRVHILSVYAETCIRRTAGRCCQNFVSDQEESIWGTESNLHILGLSMDNIGNSKESNYKYANECIFINGIFRTGDAYGLRDLHELRRKELAIHLSFG